MKTKFLNSVNKYQMFDKGDKVLVGLSGGADSICLTSLLLMCKEELGIEIEAAHINHCIRGSEANADEAFVARFCKEKNIVLHSEKFNIPEIAATTSESIELCARRIRYEYFSQINADKIATAHSGSDKVETLLMNLSRGATLKGLCSIPPVRDNIVRPLIDFTREEIECFCSENGLAYVTDSTNLSDEYTRNKYRLNVISELKKINPAFEKNVIRCIDSLLAENKFLETYANEIISKNINPDKSISVSSVLNSDKNIQPRIITQFLSRICDADFEMKHIDFILAKLGKDFSITLPGNIILSGNSEKLFFRGDNYSDSDTFNAVEFDSEVPFNFDYDGKQIFVYKSDVKIEDNNIYVADADKTQEILILRPRASADKFYQAKRKCTKPINKLLNENKVPLSKRDKLFFVADSKGVIFAEGFGIDSNRDISNKTKKYLIIKVKDGKNE